MTRVILLDDTIVPVAGELRAAGWEGVDLVLWGEGSADDADVFLVHHRSAELAAKELARRGLLGSRTILCFSGGQIRDVEDHETAEAPTHTFVCVKQRSLPALLGPVCARLPITNEDIRATVLEGQDEPVLELLSALLPIGLLWEKEGSGPDGLTNAASYLAGVLREGLPAFERAIQDYAVARILGCDSGAEAAWGKVEADSVGGFWIRQLDGKLSGQGSLMKRIGDMARSPKLSAWSEKLKDLRELLLAPTEE